MNLLAVCELGFYPLTEFLNHLDDEHKNTTEEINEVNKALEILEETFKRNAYGLYQCLYCLYGATLKGNSIVRLKFNLKIN